MQHAIPKQIGQYHIKRAIASGGMGTVYEAVQEHPRRTVAVKVMKQGISSKSALRRFEYESQVLARLRHPGIAQVYEAGIAEIEVAPATSPARQRLASDQNRDRQGAGPSDGGAEKRITAQLPFFAMEYVPNAKRITTYAEQKKLDNRGKLDLFAEVCDAVHHGHQKGIIHRDLKPANILVDSHGQPKIIDFGVARGTDSDMAMATLQTDIGQLIGTLQYMSPEQCEGDPHDIDTRSDVYALGVVLYELLSGQLPYGVSKTQIGESTRIIREQVPLRLRRRGFGSGTRGGTAVSAVDSTTGTRATTASPVDADLETIVFKALEKDRDRRYQSAIELKQDVERYLAGEAIVARPASIVYQLKIFARRNKALFGAMTSAFVVLIGGMIVSTSLYLRAEDARRETAAERDRAAVAERRATRVSDFLQEMIGYADPHAAKRPNFTMRQALDEAARKIGTSLRDEPQIEAEVRMSIAKAYMSLGEPDLAEPHYREALAIRKELFGETHETVATSITGLAWFYHDKADYAQAERLDRQALDMRRVIHGPRHLSVADSLTSLGDLARHRGDLETAEATAREAVEMMTDLAGEADKTTRALQILANVHYAQGRYAEAETLFVKTLETQKRVLGEEHPGTLASLNNLANLYKDQGRYAEAEPLYEQTLEISKLVLGEEHRDTLVALHHFAQILHAAGKTEEAEPFAREAVDLYARAGTSTRESAHAEQVLLVILRARGKLDEAAALYKDRLEIQRREFGEEHPTRLMTLHHLADMLHTAGKSEEAEPLAREAVDLYARAGIRDAESTHAEEVLLTILLARGKLDQARPLMAVRLERQRRAADEADADAGALNEYAWALLTIEPADLRDPAAALPIAQKAVEKSRGEDPAILDTLAKAWFDTGDAAKAVETQQKAVSLLPPGNSPLRKELETNLATYRAATTQPAAAEQGKDQEP